MINFSALQVEYLDSINSIIVDDGYISISLDNNLPFVVDNFQLQFLDENGLVWVNNQVQDVITKLKCSDQEDLIDSSVPRNITVTPSEITYSLAESDCYLFLPLSDIEEEVSFTNEECLALEFLVSLIVSAILILIMRMNAAY